MKSLEEVLTELYKQEINCSIHSEWDAGWTIRLGDPMNGYKEERYVEGHEVNLISEYLIAMVMEHHKGIELFDMSYKANVERWKPKLTSHELKKTEEQNKYELERRG